MTKTQTVVFEPTGGGGGSFWSSDNLLATLTVLKRAERQGRLSLRGSNRALDLALFTRQRYTRYRMTEAGQLVAKAEWNAGEPSVALGYKGRDYIATRENLLGVCGDRLLLKLTLPPGWSDRQAELGVVGEADLPLVAFYLFVAYDLNRSARQQLESLSNAHFGNE